MAENFQEAHCSYLQKINYCTIETNTYVSPLGISHCLINFLLTKEWGSIGSVRWIIDALSSTDWLPTFKIVWYLDKASLFIFKAASDFSGMMIFTANGLIRKSIFNFSGRCTFCSLSNLKRRKKFIGPCWWSAIQKQRGEISLWFSHCTFSTTSQ